MWKGVTLNTRTAWPHLREVSFKANEVYASKVSAKIGWNVKIDGMHVAKFWDPACTTHNVDEHWASLLECLFCAQPST